VELLRGAFAVVVLDVRMPGLGGLATAAAIRAQPGVARMPIIFLSAQASVAESRSAYELGASDYLTQPIDPIAFRAKVAVFVELYAQDRGELVDLAEDARGKAEDASRAKDEFLATASHELRTPLNAILGWARMMKSGKLDPNAHARGVDAIERTAKAQVQLIEDILDASRIVAGKLHLDLRPFDLASLVAASVDVVRPAADAKGITIMLAFNPAAARVTGDPDRLQQVVWNLVNNAIKFTPKGGTVEVGLARSGTSVELTVKDTGEGITSDFLPHMFDRFRQADGTTTRRHGGLGLGLALVRHLSEAHGGSVRAESGGRDLGATFTVTLPVQAVYEAAPPSTRPTPPTGERSQRAPDVTSLRGIAVLVVDDQPDTRELVATVLRSHGAEVTTAASAEDAVTLLGEHAPMILVSDVGMAQTDGYELIRRVRGLVTKAAAIPAIALTAYARDEDRRLALAAGFQAYLAKPVEPEALVRMVADLASTTT
jgi:signal transduction histidine kinase